MPAGELARRLLVAGVGIPLAVLVVRLGGWPLGIFLALLAAGAALEFFRLAARVALRPFPLLGAGGAAVLVLLAAAFRTPGEAAPWLWGATVALLLGAAAGAVWLRGAGGAPLGSVAATVGGALYTGGTLAHALFLRHLPEARAPAAETPWAGTALLLFPLAVTWVGDTLAYFAGYRWGRAKLVPSVSPGKTRVGAVAGLLGAALAGGLFAWIAFPRAPGASLGPGAGAVAGFALGIGAQAGDLAESVLKRGAGVKDSGSLLPGHGGLLDRLDALLFAIPLAYWLFALLERVG